MRETWITLPWDGCESRAGDRRFVRDVLSEHGVDVALAEERVLSLWQHGRSGYHPCSETLILHLYPNLEEYADGDDPTHPLVIVGIAYNERIAIGIRAREPQRTRIGKILSAAAVNAARGIIPRIPESSLLYERNNGCRDRLDALGIAFTHGHALVTNVRNFRNGVVAVAWYEPYADDLSSGIWVYGSRWYIHRRALTSDMFAPGTDAHKAVQRLELWELSETVFRHTCEEIYGFRLGDLADCFEDRVYRDPPQRPFPTLEELEQHRILRAFMGF